MGPELEWEHAGWVPELLGFISQTRGLGLHPMGHGRQEGDVIRFTYLHHHSSGEL